MKHQILGCICSLMVRETHVFGLPYLDENPFSIRPLEAGESGKLVGREDVFLRLQSYLKLRSARRVMLVGPLGSGRTSLVRCLKPYTGAYASIDHLPARAPASALLSMCYRQMIGGEPPLDRIELVNDLVNEMYSFNDKLPMIVIDVPASDLSVLEVALRDAHSSLERLNALLVLVCDVKERHHLPSAVLEGFEIRRLTPFSASDVLTLVRQRLATVGVVDSDFTMQDAAALLEQCDGFPASVITILRDAVDSVRMQQSDDLPMQFNDTSAKIQPRDEPESLNRLMGEPAEGDGGFETFEPSPPSFAPPETEKAATDVIDASVPWNERATLLEDNNQDSIEDAAMAGFDLNIDRLLEEQDNDEPLQATPFNTPIIDADAALGGASFPVNGMFKNLAKRNKSAKNELDKTTNRLPEQQHELIKGTGGNHYWVDETLLPPPTPEPIPEEKSAMLIHDEVGVVSPSPDVFNGFTEVEGSPVPPAHAQPNQRVNRSDIAEAFTDLLSFLHPETTSSGHHEGLLRFLQQRVRERQGPRETHALNKHVLGNLNASESYVVSVAHERDFSPSDAPLLNHLSIKRARLSQISNRLLKNGVLQVKQVGRSRKYSLTQAARAQLVAWGALQEGEA